MNVTVLFTTQLKAAIGAADQIVSLPSDATVRAAIDALADQHPEPFSKLVLANGNLMPSVLLSVNDQQVDEQTKLRDGDVLTLLSAISGG